MTRRTLLALGIGTALHGGAVHGTEPTLAGTRFVVTNTFQGAQTDGAEVDVSSFELDNNRFATVGDGVELPAFISIYDVDVSDTAIAFTWVDTEFSRRLNGVTPEGNHDRNYFVFDLPGDVAITGIRFDAERSELLPESTAPEARVLGPNRVVIDNDAGVVRGVGYNPAFEITLSRRS